MHNAAPSARPRAICLVTEAFSPPGRGGPYDYVAKLACGLRARGDRVAVFDPNARCPPGETPGGSLRRALFDMQADVVHLVHSAGEFQAPLVEQAWLSGTRVMLTVLPPRGPAERELVAGRAMLVAKALPFCDLVTVSSRSEADLIASFAGTRSRLEVHRPGAPWEVFYDRWRGTDDSPVPGLLTVVVATYNRAEELRKCLDGFTRQTIGGDRFEVIVVDDCSATPVDEVVAEFSGLLRLRLVRKTVNEGLGEARRSGVEAASGDVTLFFDDDDIPRPDCLSAHLKAHEQHPGETDAVLGFTALHPDVQLSAAMEFALVSGQRLMSYPALEEGPVPWHCAWGGRTSYKTELLRRIPVRGRWLEDTDLNARLRHVGLKVWYTRHAVQYMTHHLSIGQLRSRARTLGMAAADVLARGVDADLSMLLGVAGAAERAAEQAPQLAVVEDIIDQLSAHPVDALCSVPATLNGLESTAEKVLWAALNVVMDYENLLGFLVRSRQLKGKAVTDFAALPRWRDTEQLSSIVSVFATAFDAWDPVHLYLWAPANAAGPIAAFQQVSQALASCGRSPEDVADIHVVPVPDPGALYLADEPVSELVWIGRPSGPGRALPLALRPDVGANDLRRLAGLAPRGGMAGLR